MREWDHLILKDKILYRMRRAEEETTYKLVVPDSHRELALQGCHDDMRHMGKHRTLALLRDRVWPGMARDVARYTASCRRCQCRKAHTQQRAPRVHVFFAHLAIHAILFN